MASKNVPVPPYAQAVITKCELCDRGADARYFCEDCQEDMCKQCKITHQRIKLSRNHTVISSASEVDEEKPVFCTFHKQEQVQIYCNDCGMPICHTCIVNNEHQSHALIKLTDAVDKCRKELSKWISGTKQEISELEGTLKTVSNNKKEYEMQHNDTIDSINKRRKELKSEADSKIDKAADNLIKETKKHKSQDIKELQKHSDGITRIMADKREQIESCEEMLQTDRGVPIIQLTTEFKQKLNLGPPRNYLPQHVTKALRFVCSKPIDIQGIFGELELGSKGNQQATVVSGSPDNQSEKKTSGSKDQSSTTTDTTTVADIDPCIGSRCISTVNDKEAWVAFGQGGGGGEMELININGREVKKRATMNFNIYDIAVTSDGDLLLTDYNGPSIKKYIWEGPCIDVINTSPSNAFGICVTSHNDMLVCLCGGSGGPRVVRMTTNGQVKQTVRQDQHNKRLFIFPKLITENTNGDICVVDNYQTVVVVNREGVFRFRYPDTSKSPGTIEKCYGIACDGYGFILISDLGNHQIHQVDKDGRYVRYILTQQHDVQRPLGLSIDTTGKLWMCHEDGNKVRVIKYRSN